MAYQTSRPIRPALRGVLAFAAIYVIFFVMMLLLETTSHSILPFIIKPMGIASVVEDIEFHQPYLR